jgi:hypothetical protein
MGTTSRCALLQLAGERNYIAEHEEKLSFTAFRPSYTECRLPIVTTM